MSEDTGGSSSIDAGSRTEPEAAGGGVTEAAERIVEPAGRMAGSAAEKAGADSAKASSRSRNAFGRRAGPVREKKHSGE